MGLCPELDHEPRNAPLPLTTYALSITLDDTMLNDLTRLFKDLDEDNSGSLEAEDFDSGTAMQELWTHIAMLDENGDGQISMDEWVRGMGRAALSNKGAEFDIVCTRSARAVCCSPILMLSCYTECFSTFSVNTLLVANVSHRPIG